MFSGLKMLIAICDNDNLSRGRLISHLKNYEIKNEIRFNISAFRSGEALLLSHQKFDLVFLEYDLPKANGITVVKKLQAKSNNFRFVFITNNADVILDSFEVHPYSFLLKPIRERQVHSILDSVIRQKYSVSTVSVMNDGKLHLIPSREIIYLEGDGKYCIIRTRRDTLHSSKNLSELCLELPKNTFFRTHRSFAVNMHYISEISDNCVTFVNGEKALISRSHFDEFIDAYKKFIDNLYLMPFLNV